MARTEIKLNDVYYKLKRLPQQNLANQMSSKIGQGQSQYGDLTSWSAWIQESWQEGVGRLNPAINGGYFYGEVESRVPNQLILPGKLTPVDKRIIVNSTSDCRHTYFDTSAGTITLSSVITPGYTAVATLFRTPTLQTTETEAYVWVYLQNPTLGLQVTLGIQADSGGSPSGTNLTSGTFTIIEDTKGGSWFGAKVDWYGTLASSTNYWLVITPTNGTAEVLRGNSTSPYAGNSKGNSTVSGWGTLGFHPLYIVQAHRLTADTEASTGSGFFRLYNTNDSAAKLYCYTTDYIYKYDEANDNWVSEGDSNNGGINSAVNFPVSATEGGVRLGTYDYNSGYKIFMDDETFDTQLVTFGNGNGVFTNIIFAKYGGYLWEAQNNKLFYTGNDGSTTTTEEMYVGGWEYPVTGMAGMGESMFVSTSEALYRIAPGDFAVGVCQWDSVDESNGRSMVNFDGSLYITANKRVVRLTEDLTKQDVWVTREDDLAAGRLGSVMALAVANGWLMALVADGPVGSKPTIWAFRDSSWHFVAVLPEATSGSSDTGLNYNMYYDAPTDYLWVITPQRMTYRLYVPPQAMNPYNDSNVLYEPTGWIEWDWFDGPVREAQKDYDSVTIISEGVTSGNFIKVWWKDDDSTEWELLGTQTSDDEELRWDIDGGTRPNTKRLKLGIQVRSADGVNTPRIRAIRVKYHLMVSDWFRWSIQLDVSGRAGHYQMLADGTRQTLTADEIKDNIDTLAARVPPFVYQDVNGDSYEVKVQDANFLYDEYEYNESTSTEWWSGTYNLVLEQVTQGKYTAP